MPGMSIHQHICSEARLSFPVREGDRVESSMTVKREEEAESSPEEVVESSRGE